MFGGRDVKPGQDSDGVLDLADERLFFGPCPSTRYQSGSRRVLYLRGLTAVRMPKAIFSRHYLAAARTTRSDLA